MKVRGFQVAPAELEGFLLDHPDVADVCVVGVPDEYSGELPLAFVVPNEAARARIQKDGAESARIKAALAKVSMLPTRIPRYILPRNIERLRYDCLNSSSQMRKWNTNGLRVVLSSLT